MISTLRHRVPSASSRIVAVSGTLSEFARAPQQTRSDTHAQPRGGLDDEPFGAPEPKIGGREFPGAHPPEEQRACAERIGVEREDGGLGRPQRRRALRADHDLVVAGFERCRQRDGNLRNERPGSSARSLSRPACRRVMRVASSWPALTQ